MRLRRLPEQDVARLCLGSAELLYGRRFPLKLKGAVYKNYVRSAIL